MALWIVAWSQCLRRTGSTTRRCAALRTTSTMAIPEADRPRALTTSFALAGGILPLAFAKFGYWAAHRMRPGPRQPTALTAPCKHGIWSLKLLHRGWDARDVLCGCGWDITCLNIKRGRRYFFMARFLRMQCGAIDINSKLTRNDHVETSLA